MCCNKLAKTDTTKTLDEQKPEIATNAKIIQSSVTSGNHGATVSVL